MPCKNKYNDYMFQATSVYLGNYAKGPSVYTLNVMNWRQTMLGSEKLTFLVLPLFLTFPTVVLFSKTFFIGKAWHKVWQYIHISIDRGENYKYFLLLLFKIDFRPNMVSTNMIYD